MGGWGSHHCFCDKHSGSSPTHVPTHIGRSPFLEIVYFAVISFKMFETPISSSVISFFVSNIMLKSCGCFNWANVALRGGILVKILTIYRPLSNNNPKILTVWFLNVRPWQKCQKCSSMLPAWCERLFSSHITASTPQLLHKMRSLRADGPSLERLFLSVVPLVPHHFLRFHSAEQPHKAITRSALCRVMISFPFQRDLYCWYL